MNIRLLIGIMLSIAATATGAQPSPSLTSRLLWLGLILALLAASGGTIRGLLLRMARRGAPPQDMARWHSRAGGLYGVVWLVAYGWLLFPGRWADLTGALLPTSSLLAEKGLILLPLVPIFLVATWGAFLSTAVLRRALAAQGMPQAGPAFTFGSYLTFQIRQQALVILVPYVFVLGSRDLAVWFAGPRAEDVAILTSVLVVYALSPLMLRLIWPTEPLGEGPLRDRLLGVAERSGTRVAGIYLWRTDGIMVNACLAGVFRPLRYVFLTDTLIDQLHPAQVEAVFGHEIAHARFYHMPFFFLVALGSGVAIGMLSLVVGLFGLAEPLATAVVFDLDLTSLLVLAVLVLYWGGFFGTLSRRFERQSDLLGARLVDCPGQHDPMACTVHHPASPPNPDAICPYQAWAFTSALARIAALNGIGTRARSWRHGSIAQRIAFLSGLINRPVAIRRYDRALWTFKLVFFLAATGLAAILFVAYRAGGL